MTAHQAPLPLGFSRQEHWSGLPFPSPMHESEKSKWSHSVKSDSLRPYGLQPTRLLHPWDFPGKSDGVGCHCLLQVNRLAGSYSTWGHLQIQGDGSSIIFMWLLSSWLERGMATHSSILAWRIPWTEEPGGLQSMGSQRDTTEWLTHLQLAKTGKVDEAIWVKPGSGIEHRCFYSTVSM